MSDTDFVEQAERECFANYWHRSDIEAVISDKYGVSVVENGTGYALGRLSIDEAELYRIAVLPDKRRAHAGERLLRSFISECAAHGTVKIFLEVRSRNVPAVRLYEKCGFEKLSVRKGYYGDDDAVVYLLELS